MQEDDRADVAGERVEHVAEERRLAGARFADEREKALPALDSVGEGGCGLLDARVPVEEARVRRDPERRLAEPEVLLVHRTESLPRLPEEVELGLPDEGRGGAGPSR